MASGSQVEVMVATHNRHSVELALQTMADSNLTPQSNVYFGQLLGKKYVAVCDKLLKKIYYNYDDIIKNIYIFLLC